MGAKSILAYKRKTGLGDNEYDNTFYCITNYNGIKYYYCIYEGPDSPVISLLHQEATTEGNGTEIRIPVLEKDLTSFKKEMVRQLYYFENIIFENIAEDADNMMLMKKSLPTSTRLSEASLSYLEAISIAAMYTYASAE